MKDLFEYLVSNWLGITLIVAVCLIGWLIASIVFYRIFFKRFYDFLLSFIALVVLSPIFLILMMIGAIAMKGNPFFTQLRPGKKRRNGEEKIF